MELKDWITMFVPIFFEGIILVIYNKRMDLKFKRIEERSIRKNGIEDKFIEMINEAKEQFINMRNTLSEPFTQSELEKVLLNFNKKMSQISDYCKCNEMILKDYARVVEQIGIEFSSFLTIIKEFSCKDADLQECRKKADTSVEEMQSLFIKIDKIYYNK